jgi:hypothetical protein
LDDILVFSRSLEEHEQYLRTLYDRLQRCGILINPAKSLFKASEITFLGYKVSAEWPIFGTALLQRPSASFVDS